MAKESKESREIKESKEEKRKALDAAILQIEKQYGTGSVMRLGDAGNHMNVATVPTGSLSLDLALGLGGLPKGRIIEIYGPESSKGLAGSPRLSMPNTRLTRLMRARSACRSKTFIFHSPTTASRLWKLRRRWCVPAR